MHTRPIAAALLAAALTCAPRQADAQYEQYIGPRTLYPTINHYSTHKDIPPIMRDAIQAVAIGTRLVAVKPRTIGQAMRISGVTPAAISLLLVHLKRGFYPLPLAGEGRVMARARNVEPGMPSPQPSPASGRGGKARA